MNKKRQSITIFKNNLPGPYVIIIGDKSMTFSLVAPFKRSWRNTLMNGKPKI